MGFKWGNMTPVNLLYRAIGTVSWLLSLIFFPQIWAIVTLVLIVSQIYKCQIIDQEFKKIPQKNITAVQSDDGIKYQ